ncbi:hypothetical protein BN1723_002065 [Verticillium longisporum]|uniref:DUF7820 domain-containing protein n=1 Tax=Verticillium longisporum TaxID=100787 RepID=A0A0G4KVS4_VERLO|nr:hypothetical protein BN1723_002065 [Verticillium longisporum]
MDSSHRRQSGVGPADSTTTSVRTSISSRLDGDDDYDLSAMMIADGFRPSDSMPMSTQSPSTSLARDPSQPLHLASSASSVSTHTPETSFAPPSARPSSIAKPPRTHDPLALRHDGALGHLNAARLSRTPSSSTAIPSEYSESTINDSSGSSTAHHAYSQRTFSVATSSTMPISERSYAGPQRPTHPYGLYTQTTAPVDAPHDSDIPVGFGRPDNYRRRIGPDGEEIADMIGPLGHTEELPPYSRYPDEAYARKTTGSNEQETDADATPQQPVSSPPIPGAGGIGLATRNPEFESRDDLDTPQSRLSTRSVTSDSVSQHEINTAAQTFNEKDDHRWQKRAKKRMWGVVPYWAVCLVAVALLVMGIILGAVIGTLFAKEDSNKPGQKPDESAIPITYTTQTLDTFPLPTKPADLPPLDTGTPQSRLSTRSVTSDSVSQHEINTAAQTFNEKDGHRWQKRAKKRMWGVVPYWAVCLVAVALLVMGIILGAVIGTLFAKEDSNKPGQKPDESAIPITYTTQTLDTLPLPTKPADLPPLDTGTFSLPPLVSSQAPTTCFNDTTQAQAWTCNIPFTIYAMAVSKLPNGTPISDYTLQLTLSNGSSISGLYNWGTQPPTIDDPIIMRLVKDNDAPELGPAWFAQVAYNKTVIIAEDRFPNVGSMSSKTTVKRNWSLEPPKDLKGKGVIGTNAGDRPWICTWPGTLLEVFIYPSENNSFSGSPSPSTSSDGTTSTAPTSSTDEQPAGAPYGPPTTTTRTPKPPAPPYPKIMKIEESRVSDDDTRAAVCQQVEICDDGFTSVPVIGADGDPIEVIIVENQRLVAYHFEESKRSVRDNSLRPRNSQPYSQLSECGCMWWFT